MKQDILTKLFAEELEEGIVQLRPTNISEEGQIYFDKFLRVKSEVIKRKKIAALQRKAILFNNTNSQEGVGKSAFFNLEGEFVTSNHITAIYADENEIKPEYLWILLNIYQRIRYFFNICTNWNNQSGVNASLLKSIEIPVPDPDTQDQVIGIMNHAHTEKQRLKQEADDLLASIDAYILDRLGIKLSAKATKKIYTVSSETLTGKRLDPLYYSQEILKFVEALPYDHPSIGSKIQYMKTGFAAGRSEQELENFDEAIIQIRPTNMSNTRALIFDKNIHINKSALKDKPDALLKKGEVLFNNTNSQDLVGKTVYFDKDGEYVCSNHVTRIKTDPDELDGYYLFCILNLYQRLRVFYSICTNWNNQSGVNANLLASLPIPRPDPKIQKEIANEVLSRMTKAAALQKQALYQLDQAKAEVEKILFGDAA